MIRTLPKDPLPSTIRKLKSVALIISFLPMLWGTSLSCMIDGFFVIEAFWKELLDKQLSVLSTHCSYLPFVGFSVRICQRPLREPAHCKIRPLLEWVVWTNHRLEIWVFLRFRTKGIPWSHFEMFCPNPTLRSVNDGPCPRVLNHWRNNCDVKKTF